MGDIGKFNRRITFETLTTTPDGSAGNTETYNSSSVIWVNRRQTSSSKAIQYGLDLMTKSYQYEFRKDAYEPTRTDRIDDEGIKLLIVGIEEVEDGKNYVRVIAKVKE